MRKTVIALLALGLVVATAASAANAVRISQIYGNGASTVGANNYKCDYVELFNSSCRPVDIGGWSVQYRSATGSVFGLPGSTWVNAAMIPTGATIPGCGYYLIKLFCGTVGADLPIAPDLVLAPYTVNLSGGAGVVALLSDQVTGRTCAQVKAAPTYVDLVGYGSATCFETAAAPAGVGGTVLVRANGGMVDTDNNSADLANQAQFWPMHNTASAPNPDCLLNCGACCLRGGEPGACIQSTAAECAALNGIFLGVGVPCDPGICATPTSTQSWGQIKTIYR